MGVFTDVEMVWSGKTYTIKSNRVMGLIAQIEDAITFGEIAAFMNRGTIPTARLCRGYAAALRYAGAKVSPDDILHAVYDDPDKQLLVLKAVSSILALPMPAAQREVLERAIASAESGAGDDTDTDDTGNVGGGAPDVGPDVGNSPAAG